MCAHELGEKIKETKKIKPLRSATGQDTTASSNRCPSQHFPSHLYLPSHPPHYLYSKREKESGQDPPSKRETATAHTQYGSAAPLNRETKQRLLALASYEQQSSNWSDQGSPVLVSPRRMSVPFATLFRRSKGPVFYFNLLVRRTAHDQQLGGLVSLPFMRAMPSIPSSLLDLRADTTFIRP